MSIKVTNLSKMYGKQAAIDNISFEIPAGQTCGFLGPNGAGKSTTLKIITGYLQPDAGDVSIDGIDISKQPLLAKQAIGYLAEHNPLYKDMYVREFLQFICSLHQIKQKKQAVQRVIEQTGLQKESHKLIGQLSKGYQQRVGIAQALIHDPKVLILDEPLSGLDPNQLAELRDLIATIGKEKTVLFSSHILQEVEQVAQRILLIKDGTLVLDEQKKNLTSARTIISFEEELSIEQVEKLSTLGNLTKKEDIFYIHNNGNECRKKLYQFAVSEHLTLLLLQEEKLQLSSLFQQKTKQ